MVKRRITVRRKPTSRMASERYSIGRGRFLSSNKVQFESIVPVPAITITLASEKRMLRQVAWTEKVI